jgi:hypothetical protein
MIFMSALAVYLNFCIVSTIVYAIWGFKCGGTGIAVIRYFHYVYCLVFAAVAVLVQFADFCLFFKNNFHLVKSCSIVKYFRSFFITTDHFYFRLEFQIVYPAIVVTIIWLTMGSPAIIRISILEILMIMMWFVSGGLSLFICMFHYLKEFCNPNSNKTSIARVGVVEKTFENTELYNLFLEFSKNEWSMENVYFKSYCLTYKRIKYLEGRKTLALNMMCMFLQFDNSVFEINCPQTKIEQCLKQIKSENFPIALFTDLENDVMRNLSDVYSRFAISNEYELFKQKMYLLGVKVGGE